MTKEDYKQLVLKTIHDKAYAKCLSQMIGNSILTIEESVFWLDRVITIKKVLDVDFSGLIEFVMEEANKGLSRDSIFKELEKKTLIE